jgi:hypothetical protein
MNTFPVRSLTGENELRKGSSLPMTLTIAVVLTGRFSIEHDFPLPLFPRIKTAVDIFESF